MTSVIDIKTSSADIGKLATTIVFTGCYINCPNCHNKSLQIRTEGYELQTVLDIIHDRKELTEWIVYYGGEPTMEENIDDLMEIATEAAVLGYKQFLFTGRTHEQLQDRFPEYYDEMLKVFDYIKTGPFLHHHKEEESYHFASTNQEVLESDGEELHKFYYYDEESRTIFGNLSFI